MAVSSQKAFKFGTLVPGRVFYDSITTDNCAHVSEWGLRSKSRTPFWSVVQVFQILISWWSLVRKCSYLEYGSPGIFYNAIRTDPWDNFPGWGKRSKSRTSILIVGIHFCYANNPLTQLVIHQWPYNIDMTVRCWRPWWPMFHGSVTLPYNLKSLWWMDFILWILVDWPHTIYIYIGKCDLHFAIYWFWLITKTFWWINVIVGISVPHDTKLHHILYVGWRDLHFGVQRVYIITGTLFDR